MEKLESPAPSIRRIRNEDRYAGVRITRITKTGKDGKTSVEEKSSLHLKSVKQTISLKDLSSTGRRYKEGTPPLNTSARREESTMVNGSINKARSGKDLKGKKLYDDIESQFLLKTKDKPNGVKHSVGLRMHTGHLGSRRMGQRGTDENLILMTNSCNLKYYNTFEKPLDEFMRKVHEKHPDSNACVQVNYFVPEYGTLVFKDKDENKVELPFAPTFIAQFTVKEPVVTLFHETFQDFGPPKGREEKFYTLEFTNDFPCQVNVLKFYNPEVTSERLTWKSTFSSEL